MVKKKNKIRKKNEEIKKLKIIKIKIQVKALIKKMKEYNINSHIKMKMKISNFIHSIGNQVLIVT